MTEQPDSATEHRTDCSLGEHAHELDCDDAISQIYAYLDGELDIATVAELEAHLQSCSPCLEAYDFEAELRKVIAARCREDMPGDVRNRILQVLDRLEGEAGGGQLTSPGV